MKKEVDLRDLVDVIDSCERLLYPHRSQGEGKDSIDKEILEETKRTLIKTLHRINSIVDENNDTQEVKKVTNDRRDKSVWF